MNYKDGRTLKKYYCKCEKKIDLNTALYGSGKCQSCARKKVTISIITRKRISQSLKGRKRPEISKKMLGSGNHRFRNRTNYCDNCHKNLKNRNAKYCWNCYILLGLNTGINASNYINGDSKQKYAPGFTSKLKLEIRERDNFQCQNCDMTEEEHIIVVGTALEIHHIDYDKENHTKENLITLCKQCNIRANYNRNYWTEFFKELTINKETK